MNSRIKYSAEKNKSDKKTNFEFHFSKKDFLLVLIFHSLVKLLINESFLNFVVKIVKLLLNRPFYYFCNNRFFICREVSYESR